MVIARGKRLAAIFIALSLAYLALEFFVAPSKATLRHFHISAGEDIALSLTIAIPYIVIWILALVGYLRFRIYTETIKKSKDGAAFKTICNGLLLLSLWLPVTAIASTAFGDIYRSHPGATAALVNINNYLGIVLLFSAFLLIYRGTEQLLGVIKKAPPRMPQLAIFLYFAFSAFYTMLVLHDTARRYPTHDVAVAAYYLPDWLIVLLIIIPRLFTWYLGLQSIYNLYLYRTNVKGQIYKKALINLTAGLGFVIALIVILRCFESLSSMIMRFSLGLLLLIIYALLVLIGVGYAYIAKGAKHLQKIEEI